MDFVLAENCMLIQEAWTVSPTCKAANHNFEMLGFRSSLKCAMILYLRERNEIQLFLQLSK